MSKRNAHAAKKQPAYKQQARSAVECPAFDKPLSKDRSYAAPKPSHESVTKRIIMTSGNVGPGQEAVFKIPTSTFDILSEMVIELTMLGPITGAGSAQEAYPDGISHQIDRIELVGGQGIFWSITGDEIAIEHQYYDDTDTYNGREAREGYGVIADRVIQLGAGHTYRLRGFRNPFTNNNFPLHMLSQSLEVHVHFQNIAAFVELDAGNTPAGFGVDAIVLELFGRNLPEHVRNDQRTNKKTYRNSMLQGVRQQLPVPNGAARYEFNLNMINGEHALMYWVLRYDTDLYTANRYNYNIFVAEATTWNIKEDQRPITGLEDIIVEYHNGEWLNAMFGNIYRAVAAQPNVHVWSASPLMGAANNHWSKHIYGSTTTYHSEATKVLEFNCAAAPLTADCQLTVWALDLVFMEIKNGMVYLSHG
ncbi:MAG: hypothetical protein GY845_35435 [Planctomycetes bacterium]|nr:hypothetical protein [Planctomycetota bacterium]